MFAGIDVGSLVTKAVVLRDGKVAGYSIISSRTNPRKAGEQALEKAITNANCKREDIKCIVATGYGRSSFSFADKTVTELTCHATGAHYLNTEIRTVIDIGGQDSKVIKLDESGKMSDFAMNDKCAAGTGRFLEVMAQALEVGLDSMGEFSLKSDKPCSLSSICTVFAETEVISLIASGAKKKDIVAGLHMSIARRVGSMAKGLGLQKEIAFTGGVAKNSGVRSAFEEFLSVKFAPISEDPQIIGALGAALVASKF
ncbi:2-hydroxyglutaryl-CoA dehydratase [candidate division WOR-3 bacterium]|nr:2-hydroxyglutaryl-CoA dehydratase [candidate division WOR-3 bacterium]